MFNYKRKIDELNGNNNRIDFSLIEGLFPMTPARKARKTIAATPAGKCKLREAQKRDNGKRITYEDLEEILEFQVSRSTIERFFRGKAVDFANAIRITQVLGLKLEDIVETNQLSELT